MQFEHIMLSNVVNACNDKLVMSWAIRGQSGVGHINCLDNYEVIHKLESIGMQYLEKETNDARSCIPDDDPYPWFKKTTLIFQKK